MPNAAMRSGTTSLAWVQGMLGDGTPCGQCADRLDALVRQAEDRRGDGRAHHGDEDGGQSGRRAGEDQQDGEDRQADEQRRPVRLVDALGERLDLVEEAVRVGGEPEELRQLADDDRDRQAVHVPHLHLLGEQVGHEAELPQPEPDLHEPHEDGEHPGQRDRGSGVPAREQRGDRRQDQRRDGRVRTEDEHARGAEERVGEQAGDRRVEPRHGRQPGQLGVRHALGNEDRRQHDARDGVRAQPRAVVGAREPHAGHPSLQRLPATRRRPLGRCHLLVPVGHQSSLAGARWPVPAWRRKPPVHAGVTARCRPDGPIGVARPGPRVGVRARRTPGTVHRSFAAAGPPSSWGIPRPAGGDRPGWPPGVGGYGRPRA